MNFIYLHIFMLDKNNISRSLKLSCETDTSISSPWWRKRVIIFIKNIRNK